MWTKYISDEYFEPSLCKTDRLGSPNTRTVITSASCVVLLTAPSRLNFVMESFYLKLLML